MRINEFPRIIFQSLLLIIPLGFNGCKKDKEAEVPAYVSIPAFTFTTDQSTQGTNQQDITEAWVLVDGKLEGVFGLPANFPLLYSGLHKIEIIAGVRKSGQANFHIIYPLVTSYTTNVSLNPGTTTTINPTITYKNTAKFDWLEDFEDQALSIQPASNNNVDTQHVKVTNDPAKVANYGTGSQYSLQVTVDSGVSVFEYATKDEFELPGSGSQIFLELDVKSTTLLTVGLYAYNSSVFEYIPIVTTYPTNGEWKKFYLSLTGDVSTRIASDPSYKFRVYLRSINLDPNSEPEILLDNLKLVYVE